MCCVGDGGGGGAIGCYGVQKCLTRRLAFCTIKFRMCGFSLSSSSSAGILDTSYGTYNIPAEVGMFQLDCFLK